MNIGINPRITRTEQSSKNENLGDEINEGKDEGS